MRNQIHLGEKRLSGGGDDTTHFTDTAGEESQLFGCARALSQQSQGAANKK